MVEVEVADEVVDGGRRDGAAFAVDEVVVAVAAFAEADEVAIAAVDEVVAVDEVGATAIIRTISHGILPLCVCVGTPPR